MAKLPQESMRALREERNEALNRIVGCIFILGVLVVFAGLIIGYWATH